MTTPWREPGDSRDIDTLIDAARGGAQVYADSIRVKGEDSPQVIANVELGLSLGSAAATTSEDVDALTRFRDLVVQREGSAWMDNTTLLTGVTLLTDSGAESMTPLTIWDLATFVRATVGYEHVYHQEHPLVDDSAINRLLGEEVLRPLPVPTWSSTDNSASPMPSNGPFRFITELWFEAHSRLKRLAAHPDESTLDGRELVAVRNAWRHALHRTDIEVEDLFDWREASVRWMSPSDELLRAIARGTDVNDSEVGPDSPLGKHAALLGRPDNSTRPWLTDLNLRAYINQELANFFGLPYLCGAARVPFRRHLYNRAVAVQQRLTALDLIDKRYAELAAGVQLRLPLFLASALPDAQGLDDIWGAIAKLRRDAVPYRKARSELDLALARGDLKEAARVSEALSTNIESVLGTLGKATVRGSVAAAGQLASGDPTGIASGVAGLEAASRGLFDSSLAKRLLWRARRPYLLWMNNTIDEAQRMTEALPDMQRLWRIPEQELSVFATRFGEMAELQRV